MITLGLDTGCEPGRFPGLVAPLSVEVTLVTRPIACEPRGDDPGSSGSHTETRRVGL